MRLTVYASVLDEFNDDIDPAILSITDECQIDMSDIFDQLNITMMCCRVALLTQVEFKALY